MGAASALPRRPRQVPQQLRGAGKLPADAVGRR
nr:MAG TPA: hypothetical protein [Caudoviricetes sp.]